jgi:plasmid stabilization system protein ParE
VSYHLHVQPAALEELDQAYVNAAKHAPATATRWLERFKDALLTLREEPERFVLAPESRFVEYEIRQLNFGRRTGAFRVLFTIRGDTVHILHIRRGVRDQMTAAEIEGPLVNE